ncbi:MAG TPA: Xaa-Pro peptidase family protein [Candidatus Acidoferrales bacterium]|nr:Xaa-Pro peptidase family protein [Candidatus Acidoferrales bacterium]
MLTRRKFFQVAGLAAGAPLASGLALGQDARPCGDLPPAIAELKSMREQAHPITVEERKERLERARRLMRERRIDAILLIGGTSMKYFANIDWWLSERTFALIIPAKGEPFFVCPGFEEDRAREQINRGPFAGNPDLRIWQENESPYERVAQGLKDRGIANGRIGIEETVWFVYSDGVAHAAPGVTLTSATPVTAGCRMHKTQHEIELLQLANMVTIKAYEAAWRSLRAGMTQQDFARMVADAHTQLGFTGDAGVQVGQYSALPHGSIEPQRVEEGTILLIDGGCAAEGYHSDISRTFVLGKPTDKMKRVFDIVHRAQAAALAQARPGVEAQSVDAAARKVIEDAGYGPGYKYFGHRLGHGIGMDDHEWAYLVGGDTLKLEPRMSFSDEPGIYIRTEFGVRLEDCMHITEDGAKLFTGQSASLERPFDVG